MHISMSFDAVAIESLNFAGAAVCGAGNFLYGFAACPAFSRGYGE